MEGGYGRGILGLSPVEFRYIESKLCDELIGFGAQFGHREERLNDAFGLVTGVVFWGGYQTKTSGSKGVKACLRSSPFC